MNINKPSHIFKNSYKHHSLTLWTFLSSISLVFSLLFITYKQIPQWRKYTELHYEYQEHDKFIKNQQAVVKQKKHLINKHLALQDKINFFSKKTFSLKTLIKSIINLMPAELKLSRFDFNAQDCSFTLTGLSKCSYQLINFVNLLSQNYNFYDVTLTSLTSIDDHEAKLAFEITLHYFKAKILKN